MTSSPAILAVVAIVAAPFVFAALLPFGDTLASVVAGGLLVLGLLRLVLRPRWLEERLVALGRRTLLMNLILALVAALSTVGALEWTARAMVALGWLETYSPMRTLLPAGTADWRFAHITADRHREPDPVLLWRPRPRPPYNAQRMKGPVATLPKPAGRLRVMAYGDSNTDGPDEGGWTEHLAPTLRARTGREVEVLNAGVAGYSSHQGLLRFREDVARFQPDVVLVSFGWNDVATPSASADKDYAPPPAWRVAVERIAIRFQTVLVLRRALLDSAPPGEAWGAEGPAHRVSMADYEANLRAFAELARQNGALPVLFTRPYRLPTATLLASKSWRREVPRYNRALLDLAAREGIASVDVEAAFAPDDDLFTDECHFTPEGHRNMADLVAEALAPILDQ